MAIIFTDISFKICELASILGMNSDLADNISGITTDSREVDTDMLFIAIKGERFDGNDFISEAFSKGAAAVIAERMPENISSELTKRVFIVENSVEALGKVAGAYKNLIGPKAIAVTGSVGKTTTKEFIYSVVSDIYTSHKTSGNFNNEIGMPLSLLSMPSNTQVGVFELGMSDFGEISRMTNILKPNIAVITNIGNSHIETLGSRENICKAKLEIAEGVSDNGWIILNADDPMLFAQKGMLRQNILFVSLKNPLADYRALNIREYDESTEFDIVAGKRVITNVRIPAIGMHNVYDATYAFAVGSLLNMTDESIKRGLLSFRNTGMRQNIYDVCGITIIEDCYNASPESMKAAIEVLARITDKNKCRTVAVLGDMRELGDFSKKLHMEVGTLVAERHISNLVTFGHEAENIALGAINNGMKPESISINTNLENPNNTANILKGILSEGDVVLFKASRAVKLERVIDELKCLLTKETAN